MVKQISNPTKRQAVAFIGGGNMAASLIGGLVKTGYDRERLWVAEPDAGRRDVLAGSFSIRITADNNEAVERADTVVLAVKPQVIRQIAQELSETIARHRPLVVSVAAGVREPDIRRWLGFDAAIVRVMPNTPALVGSGATALFANQQVSLDEREKAESLLRSVGVTLWLDDESLMDVVTALSGSGPAYFFRIMEILEDLGCKMGLAPDAAHLLTLETAFGAAKMALESRESPGTLRARVTSPGGTTERALTALTDGGIEDIFGNALQAARDRSLEIGKQLGDDHG